MNPFAAIDSILEDWASPRVRRSLHAAIALVASILAIYLAAGGDWKEALPVLLAALYAGSNKANTHESEPTDIWIEPELPFPETD